MFMMLRLWLWGWSWIVTSLIKSCAILHLSFLCRQLPSLAQDTHKQFPPQQVICHRHQNYHCGHHHHFDHQQDNKLNPDNFAHHHQSNHASLKLDLDDNHSSEEELEDIIGTKKVTLNFFIFSFFALFAFLMILSSNHVFAGQGLVFLLISRTMFLTLMIIKILIMF